MSKQSSLHEIETKQSAPEPVTAANDLPQKLDIGQQRGIIKAFQNAMPALDDTKSKSFNPFPHFSTARPIDDSVVTASSCFEVCKSARIGNNCGKGFRSVRRSMDRCFCIGHVCPECQSNDQNADDCQCRFLPPDLQKLLPRLAKKLSMDSLVVEFWSKCIELLGSDKEFDLTDSK